MRKDELVSGGTVSADGMRGPAARLGIGAGALIQQLGEDDDIAQDLLEAVLAEAGTDLVTADSDDVVDVVLLWFRSDDGDLVDLLVDARRQLSPTGAIWLLTPKSGRPGHVEPSDILEAVPTAGLSQTSTVSAAADWSGSRLVAPRTHRAARR